ncbi:UNVERIFIED_ORG: hypothetical protein FHR35_000337 [Microbispora rosea subsp. rosea]
MPPAPPPRTLLELVRNRPLLALLRRFPRPELMSTDEPALAARNREIVADARWPVCTRRKRVPPVARASVSRERMPIAEGECFQGLPRRSAGFWIASPATAVSFLAPP